MKAGKLAIWPWLSCQYTENTLMAKLCLERSEIVQWPHFQFLMSPNISFRKSIAFIFLTPIFFINKQVQAMQPRPQHSVFEQLEIFQWLHFRFQTSLGRQIVAIQSLYKSLQQVQNLHIRVGHRVTIWQKHLIIKIKDFSRTKLKRLF